MTLTELKYIVAVAREKHFGRAADACYVSQPTLSVAVNIAHTYRGDLVLDLVAPDGTAYRLKNSSSSDSADNVVETFTVNASSEVANGTLALVRIEGPAISRTAYVVRKRSRAVTKSCAVVEACKERNLPIRIGVNGGSLEKELRAKYGGVTAEALVESAMGHVRLLNKFDFDDICISVKCSDVPVTMA